MKAGFWPWSWATLIALLLTTACAGSKIQRALDDHRGTDKWTKSSEAFKTIMREYVHGDDVDFSDEELDDHFEDYLTLSQGDVDRFIEDQSCLPAPGSGPARYYMANATHQRHDAFFKTDQPRPVTGQGSGDTTLHATFSANILLERHEIDASSAMPERATSKHSPFPDWASIAAAMTDRAEFDRRFKLQDPAQADAIFEHSSAIDWAGAASGELYISPKLTDGAVFSPALFAVYLFRPQPDASFSVYLTISANASGTPESSYVGLIRDGRDGASDYRSYTGFAFTYLSAKDNLLDYELVMTGEDPTSYELWITTAYPEHPEHPYLTVRTSVLPAVSEQAVASYTQVRGAKVIMMLRKGALMRDLIAAYYPDAPELKLWEEVGAIKADPKFKADLEAAGLTLAAGLFESKLWLERPIARARADEKPPQFEAKPGMDARCSSR